MLIMEVIKALFETTKQMMIDHEASKQWTPRDENWAPEHISVLQGASAFQ